MTTTVTQDPVLTVESSDPADGAIVHLDRMTISRHAQLLATCVKGAAYSNGVAIAEVERALESLDIPHKYSQDYVRPGMFWMASDRDLSLPEGAVLRQQGSLAQWEQGRMRYCAGRPDNSIPWEIVGVPGHNPLDGWARETRGDEEEYRAWYQKVWEMHRVVKARTAWCSVQEGAMALGGFPGPEVLSMDPTAMAATREGRIFVALGVSTAIHFVRDNAADNPSRTRGVMHPLMGGACGDWIPGACLYASSNLDPPAEGRARMLNGSLLHLLPAGSAMIYRDSRYEKRARRWHGPRGTAYDDGAFGNLNVWVMM